jgi:hypothetical protein
MITRRRNPGRVRTFVEGVHDNDLTPEAFIQCAVTPHSAVERHFRVLYKSGKGQLETGLLLEIPKIEVEIRPDGRSSFTNSNDVLSNRSQ